MFFGLVSLLAVDPPDQNQGSSIITLATFGLIFILFYFFMIRGPMKRQEQERQSLLSALKKNDKVVTSGGIIGIVTAIKDTGDEVTLRVDDASNVRIRVLKSSIARIMTAEETKSQPE